VTLNAGAQRRAGRQILERDVATREVQARAVPA